MYIAGNSTKSNRTTSASQKRVQCTKSHSRIVIVIIGTSRCDDRIAIIYVPSKSNGIFFCLVWFSGSARKVLLWLCAVVSTSIFHYRVCYCRSIAISICVYTRINTTLLWMCNILYVWFSIVSAYTSYNNNNNNKKRPTKKSCSLCRMRITNIYTWKSFVWHI